MSDYSIKNVPSIERIEYKQRTVASSDQLNKQESAIFNDILDLFNKSNLIQKQMYELSTAATIESSCYAKRLEQTQTLLLHMQEQYQNFILSKDDFRYNSKYAHEAFTTDNDSKSTVPAVIDPNTCDIISNITSSTSKIHIYDETYDETIIPPSLKAFVGPDSFKIDEHILNIEDSDLNNCFNNSLSNIWFRKIITDTTIESIENEIVIGLPEDIITSRLINQIIVYPYPCGYLDIMDIQYRNNGYWQSIPGFSSHSGYETEEYTDTFNNKYTRGVIKNAGNLKFNFDSIQSNQIKIKLRQRNFEYDAENNHRIWYLGLRNVDINYNRYTKNQSEFSMTYDFTEQNNIKIYDTELVFNNTLNYNVFKEYYYFDDEGNTHKITESIPFVLKGKKLMVKFTIEGAQETPNIYKCQVKYKLS